MYYDECCRWPMPLMLGYHSTGQMYQNHTAIGSWCVTCHQVLHAHFRGSSSDTTANKINPYYLIG